MSLARDFTAAWRTLRRSGSLPLVVVFMLGAALAAATAIFSIAHAVLLKPLPVADPDRLLVLWGRDDARSQAVVEVSMADLRAWREGQSMLTGIEVFGSVNWGQLKIAAPGEPFGASLNAVSAGFFDLLGARPMLGRTFRPEDDVASAPRTVILSADLWRRRFSSDPAIVGKALTVGQGTDAESVEIIGVMPPDFRIPSGAEVWVPVGRELGSIEKEQKLSTDGVRVFYAVGRLADGTTREQAATALSAIAKREEIESGQSDSVMAVVATPLVEHLLGRARPALLAIAGASAVLLLIACANAAGLLLVHGAARRHEVAVRLALGARRWQIARQFLAESAILAGAAGIAGVAIASLAFEAMVAMVPIEVPRLDRAAIDGQALLFALGTCLSSALVTGLLPAWQCSGGKLLPGLHQQSRAGTTSPPGTRVRRLLVAAQLAAAIVLLAAAGLFARSFVSLLRLDLGFDPDNVLTFEIDTPDKRYPDGPKQWAFVEAVLGQVSAAPGVRAGGAIYNRPFEHGPIGMDTGVIIEGQPLTREGGSRNPILNWEAVTPGYFEAMDIRLLRGRMFDDRDNEKAPPAVIVGESLASRLWPGQEPIGRRMLAYGAPGDDRNPGWQTVVGVVEDARYREIQAPRFDLYLPYRQAPNPVQYYMLRVANDDPLAAVPAIRAAVARVDPDARLRNVTTMDQIVARTLGPWRFSTWVVTIFSVMALTFAAVGLAAVIAYAVAQRTREIGVRIALGAQRRNIVTLMVREGVGMTLAGLVVGVPAAWLVGRWFSSLLFGVSPHDTYTFATVVAVLIWVSLVAAYLPARKAATIEPVVALRTE
jgi:predicted permease